MTITKIKKEKYFLNEKISKKLFKNEKIGKSLASKVISEVIGADYEDVYNNITLSTEEIAFSSLTLNSVADAIYYDDKIYFDIEINGYTGIHKKRQLESYVYQLYLGQLHSYKDYDKIKKVFQINIDSYDFLGYNEFMYDIYLMDIKHKDIVSDKLQIKHINLDYLRKLDYTEIEKEGNSLMKNLYFFICGDIELDNIFKKGDNLMKKVVKEVKEISGRDDVFRYFTDEELLEMDRKQYREEGFKEGHAEGIVEGHAEGLAEGHAEGLAEGRLEAQQDLIISMHKDNISIETISKYINLSLDEIKKIIKEKS